MPHNDNPMDKQFAPKKPVELNKPKDDMISQEELAKANGAHPTQQLTAIRRGSEADQTVL